MVVCREVVKKEKGEEEVVVVVMVVCREGIKEIGNK